MFLSFFNFSKIYTLQLPNIKDGVYVHGIFTNCFRFDLDSMKMASEKELVMNEQMPILHMKPQLDFSPPLEDYICPLYKTSARAGILSTTGRSSFCNHFLSLNLKQARQLRIYQYSESHIIKLLATETFVQESESLSFYYKIGTKKLCIIFQLCLFYKLISLHNFFKR